jgi:nicotinamidase-related amidase
MLIAADRSALLVVDIQERLAPATKDHETVITRTASLIAAARSLAVPVLASQQYPKGLGPLVPSLASLLSADEVADKTHFSCIKDGELAGRFRRLGRGQAVVTGMEAHVCVLQTVVDLITNRFEVFVVADAISSRDPANHALALSRMEAAGANVVSTEMVIFEWLERADRPEFRSLSRLIR